MEGGEVAGRQIDDLENAWAQAAGLIDQACDLRQDAAAAARAKTPGVDAWSREPALRAGR